MFVDTHAHINKSEYDNIDEVLENAKKSGIFKIINCSDNIKTAIEIIELSKNYKDFLFNAIGIHPQFANEYEEKDLFKMEELIKTEKIIAIGEIGLDYYYELYNKNKQIELFRKQLDLAKKYALPVIIHSREATQDTINILNEYNLKGIIHCFSGSLEVANIYIKLGFLLGFGGVLTFKNSKLFETLKNIDLKNIVLETDSPYLTPEPYRGYRNEPKFLLNTAQFVSKIKEISLKDLEEITNKNICKVFDL